jgi:ribA/ribD-fused uncharacterized protein
MWTRKPSRNITAFRGPYQKLSNFWVCDIRYNNWLYFSSEHAFQANKTTDLFYHHLIANAPSPLLAKREGRRAPLQDGWERMKVRVMHDILFEKFKQNRGCHDVLMSTRGVDLIEGNNWNDTFWGECPLGTGDNYLGRLLVGIRDEGKAYDIVNAYEAQYDADQIREKELKEIKTHARTK